MPHFNPLCRYIFAILLIFTIFTSGNLPAGEFAGKEGSETAGTAGLPPVPEIVKKTPLSLFQYSIFDSQIEFLTEGSWEAEVLGSHTITFGKGSPAISVAMPVFTQKVDLSAWVLINGQWYFEAAFADGFSRNTVAAGYYGDGILKHARIGNAGIVFPDTYSAGTIGGGSNIAPGISAQFGGNGWEADAVIRYDMAEFQEKTYSGMNEQSETDTALSAWAAGRWFAVPSAGTVSGVYAEDKNGTYADSSGRMFRKLSTAEYLVQPLSGTVTLSQKEDGQVLVTFSGPPPDVGTFGTSGADGSAMLDGTGFLGETQKAFGRNCYLASYSYNDFFTQIDGQKALIVRKRGFFSPFEIASRYETPSGNIDTSSVVHSETGITDDSYGVSVFSDSALFPENTQYSFAYAEIYRTDGTAGGYMNPAVRFPLAGEVPEAYLPANGGKNPDSDLVLRTRSYRAVLYYDIGTDAVPGTIHVYRDGISDNGFTFDPDMGIVYLTRPASSFEQIRITWMRTSEQAGTGSLAAAGGVKWQFAEHGFADLAATARWGISSAGYRDSSSNNPGSVSAGGSVGWEKDGFSVKNTLTASMNVDDTSGIYQILGMNGSDAETIYLSQSAAVALPRGVVPVLGPPFSTATPPPVVLQESKRGSMDAPRMRRDPDISGYAMVMEWDFSGIASTDAEPAWTAETVNLGTNGTMLRSARQFSVALKGEPKGYDVYLQLGADPSSDFFIEDPGLVRTWKISEPSSPGVKTAFEPGKPMWQTATVTLDDTDRSRMTVHHSMRIVVVKKTADGNTGTLLTGPYEILGTQFSVHPSSGVLVHEISDTSLSGSQYAPFIDTFNKGRVNSVLEIQWNKDVSPVVLSRYISAVPLSSYKTLEFFVNFKQGTGTAEIDFDTDTKSGKKTAVRLTADAQKLGEGWHRIAVDLSSGSVSADGAATGAVSISALDTSVAPSRIEITLTGFKENDTVLFDEFCLEGISPQFSLTDTVSVAYEKKGTVLSAGGFALIADPSVKAETAFSWNIPDKFGFAGNLSAGVTVAGVSLSGNITRNQGETGIFSGAGHRISAQPGPVSFAEEYYISEKAESIRKNDDIRIDIPGLRQPVYTAFGFSAQRYGNRFKQSAKNTTVVNIPLSSLLYTLKIDSAAGQYSPFSVTVAPDGYGKGWTDMWKIQFSPGSAAAVHRTLDTRISNTLDIPFASLKPSAEIKAVSEYANGAETSVTDGTDIVFSVPFSAGSNKITLSWQKSSSRKSASGAGGDYVSDARAYFSSVSEQKWFFLQFPVYDLFSKDLPRDMKQNVLGVSGTEKLFYAGTYSLSWDRPLSLSFADLFTPTVLTAAFAREITTAGADISDLYRFEAKLQMVALNLFGSYSDLALFKWFEQDETNQSYSFSVKFAPGYIDWTLATYHGILIFITDTNSVRLENSFNYQKKTDWKGRTSATWERSSRTSLIADLVNRIPRVDPGETTIKRNDTLLYMYGNSSGFFHEISFDHKLYIGINNWLTVTAGLGTTFAYTEGKAFTLTNRASLAGKISF